jgi:hypothetical protein
MIINGLFVAGICFFLVLLFQWSFRHLPDEKWQFIGSVPVNKNREGYWHGVNFTWYGMINACAYAGGCSLLLVLSGAAGIPTASALTVALLTLALCAPSSRLVARVVEKKKNTFSVAGAFTVGILIVPWMIMVVSALAGGPPGGGLPAASLMAAIAIAYAFGEGTGRLACISFGCCYGKTVASAHPLLQRLFSRHHFIFSGHTKKIAYACGREGEAVIPIQAITAVFNCLVAVCGLLLYITGRHMTAFFCVIAATQLWRFCSEFFREDERGGGRISAYQKMSLATTAYAGGLAWWFGGTPAPAIDLAAGLGTLWHPGIILTLQVIWIAIFLYTGKSSVTASRISFFVESGRI